MTRVLLALPLSLLIGCSSTGEDASTSTESIPRAPETYAVCIPDDGGHAITSWLNPDGTRTLRFFVESGSPVDATVTRGEFSSGNPIFFGHVDGDRNTDVSLYVTKRSPTGSADLGAPLEIGGETVTAYPGSFTTPSVDILVRCYGTDI